MKSFTGKWYQTTNIKQGKKHGAYLHRVRAEQALGKPLPPKAIVHHVDGSMGSSSQLVICQDQAYHLMLHRRMRVRAAGGDPNTQAFCGSCQSVKSFDQFWKRPTKSGRLSTCKSCMVRLHRERMKARGAA